MKNRIESDAQKCDDDDENLKEPNQRLAALELLALIGDIAKDFEVISNFSRRFSCEKFSTALDFLKACFPDKKNPDDEPMLKV